MRRRRGEEQNPNGQHVRTSRLVETSEGWYFRTREGIKVGPYPSQFDAELCASLLITRLAQLDRDSDALNHIRSFIADPAYAPRSHDERAAVDLAALRRANRRKHTLEGYRRAWDAVVTTLIDGTTILKRGIRRMPRF